MTDDRALDRRALLRRLGLGGVALIAAPWALAACGDDDDDDATTTGDAGATTTGGGATSSAAPGGDPLLSALGLGAGEKLGGDLEWQMGAVLALTGGGSFYGKTMSRGIDLAVKQIKAAGGPAIKVLYYDHKSGDATAGVNAITELGEKGVPAKLASYGDNLGSMVTGTETYKVMTLDGGGGVGGSLEGRPFLWGARAQVGTDAYPGFFKWLKEAHPDVKTVGFVGWDLGEPLNSDGKKIFADVISQAGLQQSGLYELVPPNTTDYAAVITKVRSNDPDLLLAYLFGQDPGSFMNQIQAAGVSSMIAGYEFTPDGINASKGAFEKGWTFFYDYFEPSIAVSPLGKHFVDTFKAEYGDAPDFYAANYYEDTLIMWDLIRRVLASGGNPNSGVDLENALKANPTFPSVYGGDASANGTIAFDLTSHSVAQRVMGVFHYENKVVKPLAFFDLDAADYRRVG